MINITLLSTNTRCGIIVYVCGQGVMFFCSGNKPGDAAWTLQ